MIQNKFGGVEKKKERMWIWMTKKEKEKEIRYEKEEKMVLMVKYVESVDEHNEKRKVWDLWITYEVMLVIITS